MTKYYLQKRSTKYYSTAFNEDTERYERLGASEEYKPEVSYVLLRTDDPSCLTVSASLVGAEHDVARIAAQDAHIMAFCASEFIRATGLKRSQLPGGKMTLVEYYPEYEVKVSAPVEVKKITFKFGKEV